MEGRHVAGKGVGTSRSLPVQERCESSHSTQMKFSPQIEGRTVRRNGETLMS